MQRQKILLVDDSHKFHDSFMQIILSMGNDIDVEVEHVWDSSKALDIALNNIPDVIFCDFLMPEPNGNELCTIFKSHPKFKLIPFILLTISAGDKNLLLSIEAGIDDFIVKSSSPEFFMMKIKGILKLAQFKNEALMQIEEARIKVAESSRMASLGELTANLSHQINNPLTIISGKLQKLLIWSQDNKKSISEIKPDLDAMLVKTERISQIIGYLRLCAGTADPEPLIKTSINEIIKEALVLTNENIKKSISILNIKNNTDFFINAQPSQLKLVLVNLINNSCEAVEKLDAKWIEIKTEKIANNIIKIVITDSGNGIPAENIPKLMQPFFSTKDVNKGLGLNLSISNGIIQHHKGTLTLDRHHSHTSFVIELPEA